jgi:thiosulfate reductase cytochrome b subunit
MISDAAKRSILRVTHLIVSIPILGYIYSPPAQAQQYASAARFVFVPVLILSGFWMYAGVSFAILGVGLWLAAYELHGSGAAILGQIALFIARKVWLVIRARRRSNVTNVN